MSHPDLRLTPKALWWTAAGMVVLTVTAVTVLWWPATRGLTGVDLVNARLDALKIGLSIGVGSGGVVALYLTWRRQRSTEADLDNRERMLAHQQAVAEDVRADAAERRITDLYTKAADQLGSDKAPVRLAGLYALERLAQDTPGQRQTIVNVLCAYLRMPYLLPGSHPGDDADREARAEYHEGVQERQVRLTAQNILADHLAPERGDRFWPGISLDLVGACLLKFALSGCMITRADFRDAVFVGGIDLSETTVLGEVDFAGSTISGPAQLRKACLRDFANFGRATFEGLADFSEATFDDCAYLGAAAFREVALFTGAKFEGGLELEQATFTGEAVFDRACFDEAVDFTNATFGRGVGFELAVECGKKLTAARFAAPPDETATRSSR